MARKTKEEALETRNAILDAAEIVFQEHGVSRTSLAEIAAAAGVTRGAIYWHFADKADLFDAMTQRVFGLMEEKLAELQADSHENPVDLLRKLSFHFLERVVNDPRYFRLLEISWHKCEYVGEMATIRDTHLECGNRYLAISEEAFRLAAERGFLPETLDARQAAVGLMVLVDGLVLNWTLDHTLFPLDSFGPAIIETYLAGLAVPAAKGA
ncbi:TetR family transcriptional regulator [Propionivibrio limicola]|uniref:TetR family transcriptional regulator n=1 Tax=Propionivibrio limicola TaxID=167645 RepID=UPI0012927FBF|nr:TetR family transcriptional regulator [Propionivibrio limicola]